MNSNLLKVKCLVTENTVVAEAPVVINALEVEKAVVKVEASRFQKDVLKVRGAAVSQLQENVNLNLYLFKPHFKRCGFFLFVFDKFIHLFTLNV